MEEKIIFSPGSFVQLCGQEGEVCLFCGDTGRSDLGSGIGGRGWPAEDLCCGAHGRV